MGYFCKKMLHRDLSKNRSVWSHCFHALAHTKATNYFSTLSQSFDLIGLQWWSCGQRARLLIQKSKFESCCRFYVKYCPKSMTGFVLRRQWWQNALKSVRILGPSHALEPPYVTTLIFDWLPLSRYFMPHYNIIKNGWCSTYIDRLLYV